MYVLSPPASSARRFHHYLQVFLHRLRQFQTTGGLIPPEQPKADKLGIAFLPYDTPFFAKQNIPTFRVSRHKLSVNFKNKTIAGTTRTCAICCPSRSVSPLPLRGRRASRFPGETIASGPASQARREQKGSGLCKHTRSLSVLGYSKTYTI